MFATFDKGQPESWTRVYQATYWPDEAPSAKLDFVGVCVDVSDDDIGAINPANPAAMADVLALVDALGVEVKSIDYVGDLDLLDAKSQIRANH